MAYTAYSKGVLLYQYNGRHNFYGDYYYDMYRSGTTMYYRLKTVLRFVPASGYSAYYDNPINVQHNINSKLVYEGQMKGNTTGTSYSSEVSWTIESGWHPVEKTSGTVPASVRLYDGINSSWVNYTYNMTLPITPAASVLGTISNFDLEKSFSVPLTKYSSSFTDTLEIKCGSTLIKSISGYTNGLAINLSVSELLNAYKALGSINSGNFTFNLITKNGTTQIGTSTKTAVGTANGTTKIKVNGVWKNAIPCVKVDGTWKKTIAFIKVNGVWKRGNP